MRRRSSLARPRQPDTGSVSRRSTRPIRSRARRTAVSTSMWRPAFARIAGRCSKRPPPRTREESRMTPIDYHRRRLAALQSVLAFALNARDLADPDSPEAQGYTLAIDALSVVNRSGVSVLGALVTALDARQP